MQESLGSESSADINLVYKLSTIELIPDYNCGLYLARRYNNADQHEEHDKELLYVG